MQKSEWLQQFQKISDVSDELYREQRANHNDICLLTTSVGLHVEFDDYPQRCAFGNSVHLALKKDGSVGGMVYLAPEMVIDSTANPSLPNTL